MSWFERLTGIEEQSHEQVQAQLSIAGEWLVCPNRRRYRMGRLEMPTLGELRQRVAALPVERGTLALREVVADVKTLHAESANAGALFQVASQFNLLEMVGPSVTPERGVGIYGQDPTQGPACAIAAGAGTIYRNYFVPLGDQRGQRADRQIDCLADLGEALGNADERLWRMQNGYACPSEAGLRQIDGQLRAASEAERDHLRQRLRIGIQWQTQVTEPLRDHTVTQCYGSALPVAYSGLPPALWERFARLVLEASYEATLCAARLNAEHSGNSRLFLTLLGGGVFGNETAWILDAIDRALQRFADAPLDVAIVSYGRSNPALRRWSLT
ncbi:MAG: hypothetical protein KDD73_07565 [Anaerolineales bacterium]|nr:hypothetical protein [Anaerolineales bacterium]MCB9126907.1 hypothetical protein [Ardenticatenales bacterium]MCB9171451.1 hypothetical protein [Ardenticatenales bacterium]